MIHQPVKSSSIKSVGYDPATGTMEVEFHRTGRYQYRGITPEQHGALMKADSAGAHFAQHITPHHQGKKL